MTDTHIDIVTDLEPEEVKEKLRAITLHDPAMGQTMYHQKYKGKINTRSAEIVDLYASQHNLVLYKLEFIAESNGTRIRVRNNVYEKRQFTAGLLKGLLVPVGVIIFILNIIYYDTLISFTMIAAVSILLITACVMYKAKPLTYEEYETDRNVQNLKLTFKGVLKRS